MSTSAAILALLGTLATIILGLLGDRRKGNAAQQDEIERAKIVLKAAIRDGRVSDAAAARAWLDRARQGILVLAVFLLAGGCCGTKPNPPLVLGERVRVVKPGDLTVPEPMAPAKTWYLVDDVGLLQWMGIQP